MMAGIRQWWPALPALVIAWFGSVSFVEKYPRAPGGIRGRTVAAHGPDSLLESFRREIAAESLGHMGKAGDILASAGAPADPFRPIRAHRPAGEGRPGAVSVPPPPRRYQLNGTVGTNVATITNNSGQKLIVKVGDPVDSAIVVSIETNKVVLKDRAGRFELLLER